MTDSRYEQAIEVAVKTAWADLRGKLSDAQIMSTTILIVEAFVSAMGDPVYLSAEERKALHMIAESWLTTYVEPHENRTWLRERNLALASAREKLADRE